MLVYVYFHFPFTQEKDTNVWASRPPYGPNFVRLRTKDYNATLFFLLPHFVAKSHFHFHFSFFHNVYLKQTTTSLNDSNLSVFFFSVNIFERKKKCLCPRLFAIFVLWLLVFRIAAKTKPWFLPITSFSYPIPFWG